MGTTKTMATPRAAQRMSVAAWNAGTDVKPGPATSA